MDKKNMSVKIIAEIGCNHKGNLEIAKEMSKVAIVECGIEIVKFQKRTPKELLTEKEYNSPHPNPENAYGDTYGLHREFLEFNILQHRELKEYIEKLGGVYSCSVWDMTSAREIISLNPIMIKIPSACNTDFRLLEFIAKHFEGEIHLSLGMTKVMEEVEIIKFFEKYNRLKDIVLYSCISDYPVQADDLCLKDISLKLKNYKGRVKAIGFSGHHIDIIPDIVAMTLGAEYIERHFTLDKNWKGTDHKASLEPNELKQLRNNLIGIEKALKFKPKDILDCELKQRQKLKRIIK
jgi:sialic acid synthase